MMFETRTFPNADEMKGLLDQGSALWRALFVDGIPTNFISQRYAADALATVVDLPSGTRILRFGSTGLDDAIGVELATGHVVEVLNVEGSPLLFVNSSIEKFSQTVQAVMARFPYYDTDSSFEEIDAVAAELLQMIKVIDPEAAVPDRYWSTFTDDVAMGDFTTEAILTGDWR